LSARASRRLRGALLLGVMALLPPVGRAALGPRYGGEIVVGLPDLPDSAAPRLPLTLSDRLLRRLVHETLVRIGPDGTVVGGLAEPADPGATDREWSLQLPEGAVFHDGRPIDAEAALRSVQRFLRSASPAADRLAATLEGGAAYRRNQTEELAGLIRADERRLVLRFTAPTAAALAPLASSAAAVTSSTDAGAGPFVPTLRGSATITLKPFAVHRRGRPYLDGLTLSLLEGPRTLEGEWRAGRLALAPGGAGAVVLSSTLLLVFDPTLAPFDQPANVARVVAGIPCADLVARFIPGGQPASLLLPPSVAGTAAATAPGADASRPSKPFDQEINMGVESAVPTLVSQRVVAYLGELGLRVQVRTLSRTALRITAVATPLRLILWTPEVPEPGLALRELEGLAMTAGPDVRGGLEEADRELDPARRRLLLQRVEAALRGGSRLIPLAWVPASFRIQPRLHGVRLEPGGEPVLEDAWLEP
jgi:extracellular solute-binding protein (family 5)